MDWLAFLEQVVLSLGGSAAVAGVAVVLGKLLIEKNFKWQEQEHKARLDAMNRDWEIRFKPYQAKRLEVLTDLHAAMAECWAAIELALGWLGAVRNSEELMKETLGSTLGAEQVIGDVATHGDKLTNELIDLLMDFGKRFRAAAPFLSEDLATDIDALNGLALQIGMVLKARYSSRMDTAEAVRRIEETEPEYKSKYAEIVRALRLEMGAVGVPGGQGAVMKGQEV